MYGGSVHFQYSKGNNSKSRKTRVVFGFKVMERTQKLLTDTRIQKRKLYTPLHIYFVCEGYNQSYSTCVLHVLSWFNICRTFNESMSSGFKLMEQTQKLYTHKGQ